jgi:hypothetical protein
VTVFSERAQHAMQRRGAVSHSSPER